MSWNEQTEGLIKAFTEAQTKMWENWCELLRSAPGPAMPFSTAEVDHWRELTNQCWTADSEQVVKDVAERLHVAQDGVMRFLELSLSAWKAMAPKGFMRSDGVPDTTRFFRFIVNCQAKRSPALAG